MLRWALGLAISTTALLVIGLAGLAWWQPTVSGEPWRADAQRQLSEALGREVRIGHASLRVGLQPQLRVRDLQIANAPGFSNKPLLAVDEAILAVDPADAFRAHYTVHDARLSGVRLSLETLSDQPGQPPRNNWTLKPRRMADPHERKAFLAALPLDLLAKLVVQQARLEGLHITYSANQEIRQNWRLTEATLHAREDQPVVFEADGRCAPDACVLRAETAALSALAGVASGAQTGWPVSINTRRGARVAAFRGELQLDGAQGHLAAAVPELLDDLGRLGVTLRVPSAAAGNERPAFAAAFSATLHLDSQHMQLSQLRVQAGPASVTGALSATFGARPMLAAQLNLQGFDAMLDALLGMAPPEQIGVAPPRERRMRPQSEAAPAARMGLRRLHESLSRIDVDLSFLSHLDASLQLAMDRFEALGVRAQDARLSAELRDGALTAPLAVSLWGTPFKASLSAKVSPGQVDSAVARFLFEAHDMDVGPLAREALGLRGLSGHAQRLLLSMDASGRRLSEWLSSLDLVFLMNEARINALPLLGQWGPATHRDTPQAQVQQLVVRWAGAAPLAGSLKAQVRGHPLLATLSGNSLEDLLQHERVSLGLSMQADDVIFNASGSIRKLGHDHPEPEVVWLDVRAPRASSVAGWFGLNTRADLPLALTALALPQEGRWVSPWRLQAGQTVVQATATHPMSAATQRSGPATLALHVAELHVADIDALLPASTASPPSLSLPASYPGAAGPGRAAGAPQASPATPTPGLLQTFNGRLEVRVDEVAGSRIPVNRVRFEGALVDGVMKAAPLSATVDRKALQGQLGLDLRGREPVVDVSLRADQPDFTSLARRLGLAPSFELAFAEMHVALRAQASRLADLPARASLQASVRGGRFKLRDSALNRSYEAQVQQGVLEAEPGQALRFTLAVSNLSAASAQTATLTLQSASLPVLLNTNDPVPLTARANLGSHFVELDALASRGPLSALPSEVQVKVVAGGLRLDELNRALGVVMPPWGPWSLSARLDSVPSEHRLRDVRLQIGSSVVLGSATWQQLGQQRPRLTMALSSPRMALADFPMTDWSPVRAEPAARSANAPASAMDATRTSAAARLAQARGAALSGDALLASGSLERQDMWLRLNIGSVVLGGAGPERDAHLGGAELQAQVSNGNLLVGPALLGLPGGTASFQLSFTKAPAAGRVAQLALNVPRFDYTRLARWYAPVALRESRGEVSLSAHASATVSELAELPALGRGEISARLYPQALSSQRIDIWAVNLLKALLPVVDDAAQPKVNCVVADLSLGDGRLRHRRLVLDTTGMRVTGEGQIDLLAGPGSDAYALRFQPQAKEAQFFSLATPVGVSGPLMQPRVGVSPGDLAATALRLATSWVWVPLQKLAGGSLPADGADLCRR